MLSKINFFILRNICRENRSGDCLWRWNFFSLNRHDPYGKRENNFLIRFYIGLEISLINCVSLLVTFVLPVWKLEFSDTTLKRRLTITWPSDFFQTKKFSAGKRFLDIWNFWRPAIAGLHIQKPHQTAFCPSIFFHLFIHTAGLQHISPESVPRFQTLQTERFNLNISVWAFQIFSFKHRHALGEHCWRENCCKRSTNREKISVDSVGFPNAFHNVESTLEHRDSRSTE